MLEDSSVREETSGSGNDQILPVWIRDGKALCYLNETSGAAASDGTVRTLKSKAVELDLGNRSALGSGSSEAAVDPEEDRPEDSTVEAVPGGTEESAAELTEDEMVEEAARTVSPEDVGIAETEGVRS